MPLPLPQQPRVPQLVALRREASGRGIRTQMGLAPSYMALGAPCRHGGSREHPSMGEWARTTRGLCQHLVLDRAVRKKCLLFPSHPVAGVCYSSLSPVTQGTGEPVVPLGARDRHGAAGSTGRPRWGGGLCLHKQTYECWLEERSGLQGRTETPPHPHIPCHLLPEVTTGKAWAQPWLSQLPQQSARQ